LGTRMRQIAGNLPKSLIPVLSHPFLHYQLSALAQQGVTDVVLCVGYGAEEIERYAGDGRTWNLTIRYVNEGTRLRGTGGALRLALDRHVLQSSFLVTYGDSFLPASFSRIRTAYFSMLPDAF